MKQPIHLIGLGPDNGLSPAAQRIIKSADVLVGGRAQLAPHKGHPAEKLLVGADTATLYDCIKSNAADGKRQAVLCSGDPLFYGLGARLGEQLGEHAATVRTLPGISSLQAAAAVLGKPWERAIAVSLHGRAGFLPLAHALFRAEGTDAPVFVLTDASSHPAAVAAWMLERGLEGMRMHVLEDLAVADDGTIMAARALSLGIEEALTYGEDRPDAAQRVPRPVPRRVLWLEGAPPAPPFGISDNAFSRENNLITKGPVRAAGLARLGIEPGHSVWDLGSGSGSIAVEAARLARCGRVYAVERAPSRVALIRENRRRFRALNLEILEAALPNCLPDLNAACAPDRIFIGGGLGGDKHAAAETLTRAWEALKPGGRLLVHCVLLASLERARTRLAALGAAVEVSLLQASVSAPLAGDMRLDGLNPVFLVLAEKQRG